MVSLCQHHLRQRRIQTNRSKTRKNSCHRKITKRVLTDFIAFVRDRRHKSQRWPTVLNAEEVLFPVRLQLTSSITKTKKITKTKTIAVVTTTIVTPLTTATIPTTTTQPPVISPDLSGDEVGNKVREQLRTQELARSLLPNRSKTTQNIAYRVKENTWQKSQIEKVAADGNCLLEAMIKQSNGEFKDQKALRTKLSLLAYGIQDKRTHNYITHYLSRFFDEPKLLNSQGVEDGKRSRK